LTPPTARRTLKAMGPVVGLFFVFVVVIVIISMASKSSGLSTSGMFSGTQQWSPYDNLASGGIAARGILLNVSRTGARAAGSTTMRRYENRFVTIDVEIPGQRPYEVSVTLTIPSNFVADVLPGATVELRIDPSDNTNMLVVGPGAGFSVAALNAGPAQSQVVT
jgi:hypothetical protein